MVCKKCGHINSADSRFCTACGASLVSENGKGQNKIIIALLGVIVVLLVSVLAVLLIQEDDAEKATDVIETEISVQEEPQPPKQPEPEPESKPEGSSESFNDAKTIKRNEYLDKAAEIERYGRDYFDTAMSQHELNRESAELYKKWDELLNEVYQYLKIIMPENEFEQLKADEKNWVNEKEAAIAEEEAAWGGGSGAPMACNLVGVDYTKQRCYYLISLID